MEQPSTHPSLCRFYLYQTAARVFLVGSDKQAECWRLLKFDKSPELDVVEDPVVYSKQQCAALLQTINDGNLQHGGLQLVCQAVGVLGCFQFLEGHYLLLVTKKRFQGTLCGHKVYGIEATALVPLVSSASHRAFVRGDRDTAAAEQRYRKLLCGVALNQDFFFSYSLPLWCTVQRGFGAGEAAAGGNDSPFDSDRVWNAYLSRPLREALGHDRWVLPLVHGFWQQRRLALFGRTLTLTLVARRSRQFAGTRYRKRGVNDAGAVANDVETEQVLEAGLDWRTGQPLISSMVQVRGSIPLYWAQASEVGRLKPEITLQRFDPLFTATRKHFDDLRRRYGNPVIVLNLVKMAERHPRESLLGQELAAAITHLNRQTPATERVQYVPWDLSRHAKTDSRHLLQHLQQLEAPLLRATGLFVSGASGGGAGSLQHGVLRTNCIDCLDRTNVAQFAAGLLGLGRQLYALGISEGPGLDPESSLARQLMDMYEGMGNSLALQYGGSEAHTAFFQRQRGDWEAATQSRDVLTSIRRFYSNAYTDAEKQDAINLFLGNFIPERGRPHLWELGGDYYLHTGRGPGIPGSNTVAGLARQLFLGGHSPRHSTGGVQAQHHAAAAFPPSREGSHHGGGASTAAGLPLEVAAVGPGAALGSPRSGGGGGGMVSLSVPLSGLSGLGAPSAEGSVSGSESGRETPSAPGPLSIQPGAPHLSVSTDGAEVPTLAQLVEGASPTWRPAVLGAELSAESSLEPLDLKEPTAPALEAPGGLAELGLVAAAAMVVAAAAAAGPEGEAATAQEQPPPAAAAEEQEGAATPATEQGAGAGAGPCGPAPGTAPAKPPLAPLQLPDGGESTGAPSLPVQPGAAAAAAATLAAAQQAARTPRTPLSPSYSMAAPSPRRTKLESFDKLISKPANAVRQVRLTAAPAPARPSGLASWLPSPARAKSPSPAQPTAAQRQQQQPQRPQQAGSRAAWATPPGPAAQHHQSWSAGPPSGGSSSRAPAAATRSRLSPGSATPPALGSPGLGHQPHPPPGRLVRSSSDSTLLATIAEAAELAPGGSPPPTWSSGSGGARAMPGLASHTLGHQHSSQGLPHTASASAADLSHLARSYAWEAAGPRGPAAGAGSQAPATAPTGALVVLDAWDQGSATGAGRAGTQSGMHPGMAQALATPQAGAGRRPHGAWLSPHEAAAVGSGLVRPASTDAAAGRPPRKSRFHPLLPGFSLTRGFGRSRSEKALSPLSPTSPTPLSPSGPGGSGAAGARQPPGAPAPAWPSSPYPQGVPLPSLSGDGMGSLGLPPRAVAAWWVGGADPVALMLEEEARLREQYTRHFQALSTPPSPAEQHALGQQLAALARPTWSLSMSGQLGQGAALQWRQQAGLLGAPSVGQSVLASLAAQHGAQQAQQAQQQQQGPSLGVVPHGLAF